MMALQGAQDCGEEEGCSVVEVLVAVCWSPTAGVLVPVRAPPLLGSVVELESTTVVMLLLRRETEVVMGMKLSLDGRFFCSVVVFSELRRK